MRSLPILLTALLLPAFPAVAQDKSGPADLRLTKDQAAKIQQINARYESQIKAAFAGDDKTVAAMQSELKAIDALKDAGKKKAAIAAYQAKYAATYKATLAKGKVSLNAWAADLKGVMPAYTFTLKDGTHITAFATGGSADDTATIAATPAVTTQTLRGTDFEFEKQHGCAPIGGNTVSQSGTSVTNETWAAELGGCGNYATLIHELRLASDKRALVEMKADLNVDVFAAGVLNVSVSAGDSSIRIVRDGNYQGQKSYYCTVLAPLLWVASESCGRDRASLSKRLSAEGVYEIEGDTYTRVIAGGIVAASTASSTIRNFSTKITLEPR